MSFTFSDLRRTRLRRSAAWSASVTELLRSHYSKLCEKFLPDVCGVTWSTEWPGGGHAVVLGGSGVGGARRRLRRRAGLETPRRRSGTGAVGGARGS